MPLSLDKAFEVLPKLVIRAGHVARFQDHLLAWFSVPTGDPNMLYETVMRYDVRELTVTKVQCVQVEPTAVSDITESWQQIPMLTSQLKMVKKPLRPSLACCQTNL